MGKKSQAQIKRLMKRAEARGEAYIPPAVIDHPEKQPPAADTVAAGGATTTTTNTMEPAATAVIQEKVVKTSADKDKGDQSEKDKLKAAKKLTEELKAIENDTSMKAKERRSAKRKAEAIAQEATGCPVDELLQWYEENKNLAAAAAKGKKSKDLKTKKRKNPYIVFIGQLSYATTKESLFQHIQQELGEEHKISTETVKVRLLTDPKTKKSRGMAFVEVSDPELLYSCLKLHHTVLDGRRMSVERSAGGSTNSDHKKLKIKKFRTEQEEYMDSVVKNMMDDYEKRGEIRAGELDEGVMTVCKHHSATVVQACLERYVESNGRDKDNPSAYFNFLLGKLATEGIFHSDEAKTTKHNNNTERPRKRAKQTKT